MPHFLTPRNLLWHLPTVMEFEQLRCQVCMAEFTTLPSVESHLRRVHGIRQVRSHINCSLHGTVIMKSSYQWCRSGRLCCNNLRYFHGKRPATSIIYTPTTHYFSRNAESLRQTFAVCYFLCIRNECYKISPNNIGVEPFKPIHDVCYHY